MLGNRGSLQVIKQFTDRVLEDDIRKVDIDIFKSGKTNTILNRYTATAITKTATNPLIKIDYMSDSHLIIRFMVRNDPVNNPITVALLDDEFVLHAQAISELNEAYSLVSAYPTEPGSHTLHVETANGNVADFEFYIVYRKITSTANVDVPVVDYREALLNVTKLWLLSSKYDRVRNPGWAGFFDDRLRGYPMDEAGAAKASDDLMYAINQKIEDVIITEATCKPLPVERAWDVNVVSTDTQTQLSLQATKNLEDSHIKISENAEIINHND